MTTTENINNVPKPTFLGSDMIWKRLLFRL